MKISKEIIESLDLNSPASKEPVNVMECQEVLALIRNVSKRMFSKSELYMEEKDADVQLDCIDIITAKLNEFAQIFRDIILFMREQEGTHDGPVSLRYCISSYDSFGFPQSNSEEQFLRELLLRNEITHDYFNMDIHQQKLIGIMENCMDGAIDVSEHLYKYCEEHNLLKKMVSARR